MPGLAEADNSLGRVSATLVLVLVLVLVLGAGARPCCCAAGCRGCRTSWRWVPGLGARADVGAVRGGYCVRALPPAGL
ncbi:hypothetical protein ACGF3K_20650 [Streptomyces sp. NPDC047980]|uniref:hypothetical protein n=1 Tax=Streptomyces sp. NPDC047980 TaxID=3365494 RepID=UPI00371E6F07